MCVHMLDMVRWLLDLGWPRRISSSGGILVDRNRGANITDTQTATFDFGDSGRRGSRTLKARRSSGFRPGAVSNLLASP